MNWCPFNINMRAKTDGVFVELALFNGPGHDDSAARFALATRPTPESDRKENEGGLNSCSHVCWSRKQARNRRGANL